MGTEHSCSIHPSANQAVDQHFDCARPPQNPRKLGQNKIDFLPIFRTRISTFRQCDQCPLSRIRPLAVNDRR